MAAGFLYMGRFGIVGHLLSSARRTCSFNVLGNHGAFPYRGYFGKLQRTCC